MENKINIAEILKDCPKGMELDCVMFENVTFEGIKHDEYPIIVKIKEPPMALSLTKTGGWNLYNSAKCVIFPKGKTTWEGFVPPCKFKDGDIIVGQNCVCSYITIFRKFIDNTSFSHHACLTSFGKFKVDDFSDIANLRLATEEEKTKLFDAIKENGYKWNEETKTLEKLIEPKFKVGDRIQDIIGICKVKITEVNVENEYYHYKSLNINGIGSIPFNSQDDWELALNKFDINTLKPFDKVLVRDNNTQKWTADLFSFFDKSLPCPYSCVGHYTNQCVPYEGNQHLLGTINDCEEYYKNW